MSFETVLGAGPQLPCIPFFLVCVKFLNRREPKKEVRGLSDGNFQLADGTRPPLRPLVARARSRVLCNKQLTRVSTGLIIHFNRARLEQSGFESSEMQNFGHGKGAR